MALNLAFLDVFSQIIGWTYFVAWSVSFYPQVIENWYRKNVIGLSFDFLLYNILGHSCYLIYNLSFFSLPEIKRQYFKLHGTYDTGVRLNDVIFSLHAVAITLFTIFQCFVYKRGPKNYISWPTRFIFGATLLVLLVFFFLSLSGVSSWIWMLNSMGTVKVFLSFIKYVPQAYMNWKRKCTVGWSIGNILLDFTGGCLSIGQMFVESINSGDWSNFGNFSKVGLGLLSIVFDLVFIMQHYVLYRGNRPPEQETVVDENEEFQEVTRQVDGEEYHQL